MAKARRQHPEQEIQKAIVQYIRLKYPKAFAFHPSNGGKRNIIEASIFKALGVVAGVADLCIIWRNNGDDFGRVAFLEVKSDGGKLSEHQLKFFEQCKRLHIPCGVVKSIDDAESFLALWGCR